MLTLNFDAHCPSTVNANFNALRLGETHPLKDNIGSYTLIAEEVIELTLNAEHRPSAAQCHAFMTEIEGHFDRPFAILRNKSVDYSVTFDYVSGIANNPKIKAWAIYTPRSFSFRCTSILYDRVKTMFPTRGHWYGKPFTEKDKALSWLKTALILQNDVSESLVAT